MVTFSLLLGWEPEIKNWDFDCVTQKTDFVPFPDRYLNGIYLTDVPIECPTGMSLRKIESEFLGNDLFRQVYQCCSLPSEILASVGKKGFFLYFKSL